MLRCGSGTPSPFTSHNDLEKWGWEVTYDDHAPRYYGDHQTVVQYLGAFYSPEETWSVGVAHETQVTVDGTIYPPTGAQYSNDYAPEFIISTMNESPRVVGPQEQPPVEGPFSQLERQSDLMFLEYQRKMEAMHKPMTGLKGLIRSGIINQETRSLVAQALGYKSDDRRVPDWPGRDFEADSDEGAAIVASPNGRAAAWLLGTHKEQLGHKIISKVRV